MICSSRCGRSSIVVPLIGLIGWHSGVLGAFFSCWSVPRIVVVCFRFVGFCSMNRVLLCQPVLDLVRFPQHRMARPTRFGSFSCHARDNPEPQSPIPSTQWTNHDANERSCATTTTTRQKQGQKQNPKQMVITIFISQISTLCSPKRLIDCSGPLTTPTVDTHTHTPPPPVSLSHKPHTVNTHTSTH